MDFIVILLIYLCLGYASIAYLKGDSSFADGIARMVVLSVLFGWAAIPIAVLFLGCRGLFTLIKWLLNW